MKKKSKKKLTTAAEVLEETLCCGTTEPHGHTATFPEVGRYDIEFVSLAEARQNRLDIHDGTAELRLKLKNSLDLIAWENNGETITGKADKLQFVVRTNPFESSVEIFEKCFLYAPQLIRVLSIDDVLYEKIALRANVSVPNRSILKLLTAL